MKTWAVPRSYWKIPENGLFWWYQVKNHTPQDLRQYVSLCISLQSISVCAPSFNSPCRVVIQWSDPRSAIWVPPAFLMPSMPFNVISLRMLVSTFLGRSTLPVPRRQISKTSRHQQHDLVGGFSPYPSEKWWSESQLGWLSHIMENITSFFWLRMPQCRAGDTTTAYCVTRATAPAAIPMSYRNQWLEPPVYGVKHFQPDQTHRIHVCYIW